MDVTESSSASEMDFRLQKYKNWMEPLNKDFLDEGGLTAECEEFPETQLGDGVYPEMRVTNFYAGGRVEGHCSEHEADARFPGQKDLPKGWEVQLKDAFMEKDGKIPFSVCLVGPAGSGKSFAMKHYLCHCSDGLSIVLCGKRFCNLNASPTSVFDFIFPDKSEIPEESLKEVFEWMKAHPDKVNFLVDSLDTLSFPLSTESLISDTEGLQSHASILSSIMAQKLFPGCKIFSSSREYGIIGFPEELRADRIISLTGLSEKSIRKHISSVRGDKDGKELCDKIETTHAGLWALLSTPVFLVFFLMTHVSHDSAGFIPTTMSGIMVKLLLDLSESRHSTQLANVKLNMRKLKRLSYNGIDCGKVTFEEKDIGDVDLKPGEASALSIFAPLNSSGKPKLLQGRKLLFFCHQCIQEFLAALWILDMDLKDFEDFVKCLNKPRLAVVRCFLAGVLLNEEVRKTALQKKLIGQEWDEALPETEKKQEVLKKFLEAELKSYKKNDCLLGLFITLSEAGDKVKEIIQSAIISIDLCSTILSVSDTHAVGSVVRYCKTLQALDVSRCDLNPAKLHAFLHGLGDSENCCEIGKFRLKHSCELGEEGMRKLGDILKKLRSEKVTLDDCQLNENQLKIFSDRLILGQVKVPKLYIRLFNGYNATSEMTQVLLRLLPQIRKTLNLFGWTFDEEDCRLIENKLTLTNEQDESYNTRVKYGKNGKLRISAVRKEDCFENLVQRPLLCAFKDMKRFALVSEGLGLSSRMVQEIEDNHRGYQNAHAHKLAFLEQWWRLQERPSVHKLQDIVNKYREHMAADIVRD